VVTGIDIVPEKYILLDNLKEAPEKAVEYLNKFKSVLLSRKIRKFNENNWFEWGALRNIKVMKAKSGQECIYISNLSRKEKVAFTGKVNFFGGNLLMMVAKDPSVNTKKAVEYLNSTAFRENFTFSGRFKIGQRQICNTHFPGELLKSASTSSSCPEKPDTRVKSCVLRPRF
jgi:adenine-specific DNA-methyltransferase